MAKNQEHPELLFNKIHIKKNIPCFSLFITNCNFNLVYQLSLANTKVLPEKWTTQLQNDQVFWYCCICFKNSWI